MGGWGMPRVTGRSSSAHRAQWGCGPAGHGLGRVGSGYFYVTRLGYFKAWVFIYLFIYNSKGSCNFLMTHFFQNGVLGHFQC